MRRGLPGAEDLHSGLIGYSMDEAADPLPTGLVGSGGAVPEMSAFQPTTGKAGVGSAAMPTSASASAAANRITAEDLGLFAENPEQLIRDCAEQRLIQPEEV